MAKIILQAAAISVVFFILATASLMLWRSFHPIGPPNEAHGTQNSEAEDSHGKETKSLLDRTSEDPVAFFTLWLTLFTGILAAFTVWMALSTKDLRDFAEEQARDMKESLAAARASADAAKAAVELSDRTAERQLRAYVGVDIGAVLLNETGTGVIGWIRFKNFGVTPAYKLRSWMNISKRLDSETKFDPVGFVSEMSVGPGGIFMMEHPLDLSPEHISQVKEQKASFYMWGRIEYIDAFEKSRYLNFKARMTGPIGRIVIDSSNISPGWGFNATQDGNNGN